MAVIFVLQRMLIFAFADIYGKRNISMHDFKGKTKIAAINKQFSKKKLILHILIPHKYEVNNSKIINLFKNGAEPLAMTLLLKCNVIKVLTYLRK